MTVLDRSELDDVLHVIDQHSDVLFTWDYERSRPCVVKLYEKAKTSQWNASTQLDWSIDVDLEKLAAESAASNERFNTLRTDPVSPLKHWATRSGSSSRSRCRSSCCRSSCTVSRAR